MSPAVAYNADVEHPTPLTGFTWVRLRDGQERYEVSGICPVCRCSMTKRWPVGQHAVPKGGFPGRRQAVPPPPWYTTCTCASVHLGRPPGDTGCGAGLYLDWPASGLPR
ncbi:hypothetical protein ACFWXK_06450 [Streptomyces sp. NPDC059070]|uniref:hypothetical protein n=1 Tax=unclassified Streptomyces TaxID=2593676 RepID=UPI0034E27F4A